MNRRFLQLLLYFYEQCTVQLHKTVQFFARSTVAGVTNILKKLLVLDNEIINVN